MDPISIASFAMAVVGTVEICLNCYKSLASKLHALQHADDEISKMILKLEGHAIKIKYQCEILHGLWKQLDGRMQVYQNQVLLVLKTCLQAAVDKMNGLSPDHGTKGWSEALRDMGRSSKRLKYTMMESSLRLLVKEIEDWESAFDPSWYLIARMATPLVDEQLAALRSHVDSQEASTTQRNLTWLRDIHNGLATHSTTQVSLRADYLQSTRDPLPCTSLELTRSMQSRRELFVDTREILGEDVKAVERDVKQLAHFLSHVPADFGILQCRGYLKNEGLQKEPVSFELVFNVPPGLTQPQSLRKLLCSTERLDHHLTERVRLAKLLAKSVLSIHNAEFVHKNVSPDSIIVLTNETKESGTSTPFLTGFGMFRHADSATFHKGDNSWEKNLYRHPTRQGIDLDYDFQMQHDIYSLGVCMLEIGLWSPFVLVEGSGAVQAGPFVEELGLLTIKDWKKRAAATKQGLCQLAETGLPANMGGIYTDVTLSCLTCLDDDGDMFGNQKDFKEQDSVQIGVQYAEKVLLRLNSISV